MSLQERYSAESIAAWAGEEPPEMPTPEAHRAALLPFPVMTADRLQQITPRTPEPRIAGVLPARGGAVLIAQAGSGKTTMLANLAYDLLEGTPFLGTQPVRQIGGRVAVLSYEMDNYEILQWFASVGVDLTRLVVLPLRDVPNPLADWAVREVLAQQLSALEVEVVMVDTFARAFTGESQDSAADVTRWFADLNNFTREQVGAKEWIVAAHAGWNGDRGRGSSALHDAPDSVLVLTRDKDTDVRTLRCDKFRGSGPLPRTTVAMDPDTYRLSIGDAVAGEGTYTARIRDYITTNPGCTTRQIRGGLGIAPTRVTRVLEQLTQSGEVNRTPGPRNSWQHTITPPVTPVPTGDQSPVV